MPPKQNFFTELQSEIRNLRRDNSDLSERIALLEREQTRLIQSVEPRSISHDLGRQVEEQMFAQGLV